MKCNLFPAEPGRAGGRRVSLSRPVIGSHGLAHALERVLVMVCVCVSKSWSDVVPVMVWMVIVKSRL